MENIVYVYNVSLKYMNEINLTNWKQDRINRIQKAFKKSNEFFCAFKGNLSNQKECLAICAFEPENDDIFYLDQFCSDGIPGIGFITLQKAIEYKYDRLWLISSPEYDKRSDSYLEANKLNSKYREQSYLKEIALKPSDNMWNCPVSLFHTKNVSDDNVLRLFHNRFG